LFLAAIVAPNAQADAYVNGSFDGGTFTIDPNGFIQVTGFPGGITAADITIDSSLGVAVFDMPPSLSECTPYDVLLQGCVNGFDADDPSLSTISAALTIGYLENGGEVFLTPNATLTVAGVTYVADDNFMITGSPVVTSPALTPEPPTGILLLAGVGLLIVTTRKRIAQDLPQAS
jgi:hypothetical protein